MDLRRDMIELRLDRIWAEYEIQVYFYNIFMENNYIGYLTYSIVSRDAVKNIINKYDLTDEEEEEDMLIELNEILECPIKENVYDIIGFMGKYKAKSNDYIYLNKIDVGEYRGAGVGKIVMEIFESIINEKDTYILTHPYPISSIFVIPDEKIELEQVSKIKDFYLKCNYKENCGLMFKAL